MVIGWPIEPAMPPAMPVAIAPPVAGAIGYSVGLALVEVCDCPVHAARTNAKAVRVTVNFIRFPLRQDVVATCCPLLSRCFSRSLLRSIHHARMPAAVCCRAQPQGLAARHRTRRPPPFAGWGSKLHPRKDR